jgi:hypothetical protein
VGEKRLDLRAEEEAAVRHGVVEWLDADAVACEEQPLAARIPDRECEHPPQMAEHRFAVLLVEVHEGLGVGSRAVDVPARHQLRPQLSVVVDLSIEGDPDGAVLVDIG